MCIKYLPAIDSKCEVNTLVFSVSCYLQLNFFGAPPPPNVKQDVLQ